MKRLTDWFCRHPRVALALSGGCDSALLLHAAVRAGAEVLPYMVQSQFQPEQDGHDARQLAASCQVSLTIIDVDILAHATVAHNPPDRCYHCKHALFAAIVARAQADGLDCVIDGSNASDIAAERPGMRALEELGVHSPLRACGITKAEVRALSRELGIFTWNKPANACLATRIPTGTAITANDLARIARAERALHTLGFSDVRVRLYHDAARIQLPEAQLAQALARREHISSALHADFAAILLDLAVSR